MQEQTHKFRKATTATTNTNLTYKKNQRNI